MRGCPASDLCFAFDSSSRAFRPIGDAVKLMTTTP